jgi:protein-S-isoprenylcysteine O-methyltransferase Ste14
MLFASGPVTITFQLAAVLLMVWARATLGRRSFHAGADPTEGWLVVSGPYRYVRHPIYSAIMLFVSAGMASHLSARTGVVWSVMFAAVLVRIFAEETLVRIRYPEYDAYSRRTKRLVPFVW